MPQKTPRNQLRALQYELRQERAARERVEAESESKSSMVATVSHELRTPIGAIISMADLLQSTVLDKTQRHYCETLQNSARGLLTVLNDILDLSKLRSDRIELNLEDVDLAKFFKGIETMLGAKGRQKGLDTAVTGAAELSQHVRIDQMRLYQIVTNLIDNAVKFTADGSVTIAVSLTPSGTGKVNLHVEVADTGMGFDGATKEKLFEPFVQGTAAVAASHGGTGLGLSIVKDLVRLMGGAIDCEATPGKGARFWFDIPCDLAKPPASASQSSTARPAGKRMQAALSGRHALVIEDNKINQTLIGVFLDKFGMTYHATASGEDAIRIVQSEKFDVVLMDVRMHGMDGVETTRQIRALNGRGEKIPIIALTAYAMDGDMDRFLAAGMNAYVPKPIEPRELYAAIEAAIELRPVA